MNICVSVDCAGGFGDGSTLQHKVIAITSVRSRDGASEIELNWNSHSLNSVGSSVLSCASWSMTRRIPSTSYPGTKSRVQMDEE